MKVLLYFEKENKIRKSGIGRALDHQIKALNSSGIDYTLNPKDNYDIAHINTYFPASKRLIKKLKKKGIPVIVHGHSTLEDFKNSFRCWRLVYHLWYKRNLLWFYRKADLIITPTEYSKQLIDNYGLSTNVIVISNGIDLKEYEYNENLTDEFKKKFNITNEKVVLGMGLPFNRKGIKDFFAIAKVRPDIKFIWFGGLNKILVQQNVLFAIRHRPDNVLMPGYVDSTIVKGALQYAKCFLFTSYEETEGIVVLEALAKKCPVIIRDIGVYKDWLVDGLNCYKGKTTYDLVHKLNDILDKENNNVIEEGYKVASKKNIKIIGEKLLDAYKNLIGK